MESYNDLIESDIKTEEVMVKDEFEYEDGFESNSDPFPVCMNERTVKTEIKGEPSQHTDEHKDLYENMVMSTINNYELQTNLEEKDKNEDYINLSFLSAEKCEENLIPEWSNEVVLQFLDHLRDEPIIWKAAHPQHKIRHEVYDAWKRIEAAMNNKFRVNELKKKKDSLMASFRTCSAKVRNSLRSGVRTCDIYKPSWFAYEKMATFLIDKNEPRATINLEDSLSQSGDGFKNANICASPEYKQSLEINVENDSVPLSSQSKNIGILLSSNTKKVATPTQKRTKRFHDDLKRKINSTYSLLESSTRTRPKRDLYNIYGELVAAKLKAMDAQTREVAMHRIDNLLFEMRMSSILLPK